jgi:hypothetical protein
MYGVIGEADSDAATLKVLIKYGLAISRSGAERETQGFK